MGVLFSKPLTAQVDASALRGAELYERLVRSASHLLSLFFIPLLNSPFTISTFARSRRAAFSRRPEPHHHHPGQPLPTLDSFATTASFTSGAANTSGRYYQHARLAELGQYNHGLRRVQSNASRSSRATSLHGGAGGGGGVCTGLHHNPYSLAGIKANRETIQRRRARAELAAAGVDVQLHRRNSARSSTPSASATASSPSPSTPTVPKRYSLPVRPSLTPALEPTPRLPPARRPSRRARAPALS
ncbi:hypothetical protein OC835_006628 [Tilletia horrida]|uniref:Uncharacterized protein n=1 Tax=Tilletia horrida TaxID=155126 RepID=A0AAN6JU82_9BASI|nr:hypothetical protein OC835_006628 [Tilletia horrida]KAK0540732.1 hypothetical protein OC842_000300 [Tilletia horrida]KAK0560329.1 hypothetical protein OC844_003833 [Tilletia horrida]